MRNSESEHYTARSGESDARPRGWLMRAPSPRLRGEGVRGRGRGSKPGKIPLTRLRAEALATSFGGIGALRRAKARRADLSPQAGRGGASRAAVHQYERDML